MAQLFPSVVVGVFTRWFHPWALFVGWLAGMASGTAMAVALGLKISVYPLHIFGSTFAMYAAVPALLLNLLVSVVLTIAFRLAKVNAGSDVTDAAAYVG